MRSMRPFILQIDCHRCARAFALYLISLGGDAVFLLSNKALDTNLYQVGDGSRLARLSNFTIFSIGALFLFLLIWSAFAEIDEVTRGDGKVIPSQKIQSIQSSEPGVVEQILVRLGQHVAKGDLLIRLDNTMTESTSAKTRPRPAALRHRSRGSKSNAPAIGQHSMSVPMTLRLSPPMSAQRKPSFSRPGARNKAKSSTPFAKRSRSANANSTRRKTNHNGSPKAWAWRSRNSI